MQHYGLYLIRALAIVGLLINMHFVYTHNIRKDKKHKHSGLCAGNKCDVLVDSKYANIFSVPNYILSIFYYLGILIVSFTPYFLAEVFKPFVLALVWFIALLSIYLFFVLVFKLKAKCYVCFSSQAINLLIAIIYTVQIL